MYYLFQVSSRKLVKKAEIEKQSIWGEVFAGLICIPKKVYNKFLNL